MPTPNLASLSRSHCQRLAGSGPADAMMAVINMETKEGETQFCFTQESACDYFPSLPLRKPRSITKRLTCGHTAGICFVRGENHLFWCLRKVFFFPPPYRIMVSPNYLVTIYKQRMIGNGRCSSFFPQEHAALRE